MTLTDRLLGAVGLQKKALPPLKPLSSNGPWWPLVRESFTGAWQQNVTITASTALAYFAVYACVTLIAGDISKLFLRLVEKDENGIWNERDNPAFSPVLRKPNRYQTIVKFLEQWMVSKLAAGNTYVLKQRDQRGIVTALYVLDPVRVLPLVTSDGAVYYEVRRDDLAEVKDASITVPASEIIHDIMCPLYHPLIGVTPIYAAGVAATQGIAIQNNSSKFFTNMSRPSGMLTAPGAISDTTAERLKAQGEAAISGTNIGRLLVAGDGLKFEAFTMSAVDAQLIEQLKWTADTCCSCYHVPPYMIGVGPPPPYANVEPLVQQYYAQCLQALMTNLETCLDDGLGLGQSFGNRYGAELDITDLIWMDTATKTTAAQGGVSSGAMSPNEARRRYFNLGPVKGGETPYLQQQNYSLAALAKRDAGDPFAVTAPERITAPAPTPTDQGTPVPGAVPVPVPKKHLDAGALRSRVDDLLRKALAA